MPENAKIKIMDERQLALKCLQELDIIILVRVAPQKYRFSGLAAEFYDLLFPRESDGQPCREPWLHSAMLGFFLEEAESFFAARQGRRLDSGLWLEKAEDGSEVPLTAFARYIDGLPVITIHCVREYYSQKVSLLRQARNELSDDERLHHELADYRQKSLYDSLTKLYNRDAFAAFVDVNIANRRNTERNSLALLIIDIDSFKQVNQRHGRAAGDKMLADIGDLFSKILRRRDIAARYGDDEFAVLAPQTDISQALVVAEKLRRAVQSCDFGLEVSLTVSIGFTVHQQGESAQRLLIRAEDALHVARQSGRDQNYWL